MMKFILKIMHLGDNKKNTSHVSETDMFIAEFDKNHPQKSESQKKEILKHRNIFTREEKKKSTSFLDG